MFVPFVQHETLGSEELVTQMWRTSNSLVRRIHSNWRMAIGADWAHRRRHLAELRELVVRSHFPVRRDWHESTTLAGALEAQPTLDVCGGQQSRSRWPHVVHHPICTAKCKNSVSH
jgi:hypothetical protein